MTNRAASTHTDSVPLSSAERRRGLMVVTIALAIVSLIHGLTLPMLSLILERAGVNETLIGLNATAQFVAVFAAAPFIPRLMRGIGPAAMMFWSVLSSAMVFLALPVYVDIYVWFALRLVLGVALSFLWIAGEAWVNHMAQDSSRGRTVALFGVVTAAGYSLGPLVLAAVGSEGWTPFLLAAGVMALAAVPLGTALRSALRLSGNPSGRFWQYVFLAPVSMWMYFAFSAAEAILLTFLPIYAMGAGVAERLSISLLTAMAVGAIASQFPIGWMSDRLDAMLISMLSVLIAVGLFAALPLAIALPAWNIVYVFALGTVLGAFYTLSLVFLGRRFSGADLGPATTVRSIMFCLGAMLGPPLAGTAIEHLGPQGMPLTVAVIFAFVLPLPVFGFMRRWLA